MVVVRSDTSAASYEDSGLVNPDHVGATRRSRTSLHSKAGCSDQLGRLTAGTDEYVVDHPKAAARAAKRATKKVHDAAAGWADAHPAGPDMLAAGRFAARVKKRYGWWTIVDPHTVAEQLSDEQWEMLMSSHTATQTSMRTTITARDTGVAGD